MFASDNNRAETALSGVLHCVDDCGLPAKVLTLIILPEGNIIFLINK